MHSGSELCERGLRRLDTVQFSCVVHPTWGTPRCLEELRAITSKKQGCWRKAFHLTSPQHEPLGARERWSSG